MQGKQRIGVLLGGLSGRHETSLRAGQSVLAALADRGHDVIPIFVDRDVDLVLRQAHLDLAFLALQGRYGADGCIQGLLEVLGIPYTGSGVMAAALALNKAKTKEVLRLHNLPTAPAYVVRSQTETASGDNHGAFGFPVVVRPVGGDPLLGASIARDELELEHAMEDAFRFDEDVLVERFIDGRVLTVGLLDGHALGALDLGPSTAAWGFSGDRGMDRPEPQAPSRIGAARYHSLLRLATQTYESLGLEGAATVELVVTDRTNEVIVSVDAAPPLSPTSPFARIACGAGMKFSDLLEEILQGARLRAHGHRHNRRASQLEFDGPDRRNGVNVHAH